ncbi:hypothetical protein M422DRAFT_24273 [Sphaerobolus stellatus SS14]|nr:hypothetical protein M422DRAFT_24273 [Sphaerobolus stellatus SS14]
MKQLASQLFGILVTVSKTVSCERLGTQAPLTLQLQEHQEQKYYINSHGTGEVPHAWPTYMSEKRLLKFENGSEVWVTEADKFAIRRKGQGFFDITEAQDLHSGAGKLQAIDLLYPPLVQGETVRKVISKLSTDEPQKNLWAFTTKFLTRFYRSNYGLESQKWLLSLITETVTNSAAPNILGSIEISEFPHSWPQSSIILRIKGTSQPGQKVIIGAHLDSASLAGPLEPAPGAEDDGSGTIVVLEALRVLLESGFRPNRTVEFHWYAAEEGGLLGSQDVAKAYKSQKADIYSMVQFDMTAWVKKGTREEIGIVTDLTSPTLSQYLRDVVDAYLDIPHVDIVCGYGCSDHASWNIAGYPSSLPAVSQFKNISPNIHSENDRIDISEEFSFEHMLEFSKIAVAVAVEMGEWELL